MRWQGVLVGLRYVESALNPADCVSRWWGEGRDMVVEATVKAGVYSLSSSLSGCTCTWHMCPEERGPTRPGVAEHAALMA